MGSACTTVNAVAIVPYNKIVPEEEEEAKEETAGEDVIDVDGKSTDSKQPLINSNDQADNEEERKAKEQLKKQKKKKDSRSSAPSQSGYSLENFKVSSTHIGVPAFVVKCVNYIEEEGLAVEGIYRVPGNKGQVDIVTTKYNEDPEVDFHTLEIQVNAVATVLKQFFMDLQDPLIPPALYDELVHAAGIQGKSSCLLAIRGVLKKLEQQNFQVLSYLMAHLHKVAENSPINNMDSKNLSRCWWPTLMRVTFKSYESMTQYSHYHEVILQTLIDQYQFIFFGGDEV